MKSSRVILVLCLFAAAVAAEYARLNTSVLEGAARMCSDQAGVLFSRASALLTGLFS